MLRNALSKIKRYLARPSIGEMRKWRVTCDDDRIVVQGKKAPPPVPWSKVRRIAYVTSELGPFSDYQIAIQRSDQNEWIVLEIDIPGVRELISRIDRMPGTTYGPRGKLANCTTGSSVVIWPATEAGKTIEECSA